MKIYIWQNNNETSWYIHLELDDWIYQLRGKTDDLFKRCILTDNTGKTVTVILNRYCQLELFYQMKIYKFNLQPDNRQGDKKFCVLQGNLLENYETDQT